MDKSSIKISIVASQFNELIVESLIESSIETLEKKGYRSDPEIFKIP
ncbi:MAG: 6,7-dimethyl-8-ribityllumazine synthase, partial [Gammaproteobacteria bacterium]